MIKEFDMAEIHEISVGLLEQLENEDVDLDSARVALAMSFGRMCAPELPMSESDEVDFIGALMNFGTMYFVQGVPN